MNYFLPDKAYKFLKWAALIAIPAVAWFISEVGPVWGLSDTDAVVTTLNATGTLIGVLIGVSQAAATPKADDGNGD